MDIKTEKQSARDHARAHRDSMDVDPTDFETVIDVFFEHFKPEKNQVIALYWPNGKEFDSRFLMDELVKRDFKVALPIATKDAKEMHFCQWTHDVKMEKGAFGVSEPQNSEALTPDIVIVPFLAFDQRGFRLGQGGGHYDATIEALRKEKDIVYVGLGWAEQAVLFKLPREAHDIPMDYVLSPQGMIDFRERHL